MKNKLLLSAAVIVLTVSSIKSGAQSWKLTGNSGTNPSNNFLGTTDNKTLIFRTNNIERMRIGHLGNIGISVANPAAKLQVDSGDVVTLGGPAYFIIGSTSRYNLAFDYNQIQARTNGTATALYLNYLGSTTFIGNSTKSTTGLVANGSSRGLSGFSSGSGSTGVNGEGPSDGFGVAGSGYYGTFGYSSSGGYGLYGQGANAGTYGVEGYSTSSIGVYGVTGTSASYAGFFVGSVYTTGTYNSSDEKLKQNIQDFSSAVNIITQLHPKQYEYRQDGNYKLMNLPQGEHFGFVAQDIEKVLPGLVKNSTFDVNKAVPADSKNLSTLPATETAKTGEVIDFKAVNYTELIPILVKAVQEQQTQIQTQNEKINELEQKIQTLTSQSVFSGKVTGAMLQQNTPNPFTQNTMIKCTVPSTINNAQIVLYTSNGKQIKTFSLNNNGMNEINFNAGNLIAGQYVYTLVADGKTIDSKTMMITK